MTPTELIDLYCEAWGETDPHRRAAMLRPIWNDGATYTDPTVHLSGLDELVAYVDVVLARRPNSRVERTTLVDIHHGLARFG